MTLVLFFIALISVLIATAFLYIKNAFSYWQRKGIVSIKPTFPFGNFGKMFMQKQSLAELVIQLYNSTTEPVLGVYITLHPSLIVRDPIVLRDIFIKEFSSFYHRGTNPNEDIDPMSNNLLMQNGVKWKQNRMKLTPAFTSGKLKGMFDTIVSCASSLDEHIEQFAKSGKSIEIRDVFAQFATNVIASVAFGIDVDCIKNPDDEFRRFGQRFFDPTPKNMLRFHLAFIFPQLATLLRLRFTDKDVGDFMTDTVRQNLEYREKNNVVRKDFFQLLMQLRNTGQVKEDGDWSAQATSDEKKMSLEEMSAHSFVFYTASFESSSSTMSFCMYEMSKNPATQKKAQQEIDQVLARYNGKLTYESINEMKYVENCLDETLRMHPAFGTVARKCMKDYKIPNSNLVIPVGTSIIIPVAAIHLDKTYYDQPNQFIPERFDDKQIADKTFIDMPYLPFGEGPRTCIGLRLAKLQVKIGIVLLLRKFRFELDEKHIGKELKVEPRSIAKLTIGGINLKVKLRE